MVFNIKYCISFIEYVAFVGLFFYCLQSILWCDYYIF